MTVQVRPTPARTWGNSIRPFQSVKPGPQLPSYTLKTWKPPVPEPLPPAPLLGLPSLLALGALVLSQAWGLFSGRPSTAPATEPPAGLTQEDIIQPTGWGYYQVVIYYDLDGYSIRGNCLFPTSFIRNIKGPYRSVTIHMDADKVFIAPVASSGDCDGRHLGEVREWVVWREGPMQIWGTGSAYGYSSDYWEGDPPLFFIVGEGEEPVFPIVDPSGYKPQAPEFYGPALPSALPFPWITPEELAAIRPVPLPLPDAEPLADPANPQPQTTPLTVPAPLVAPTVPLLRPLPAGVQLLPGGTLPTPQAAAVPQTPQGTHYPATGLAIPANPPAPTLQGIAQEVGRVESKLNKLLNPATGNNFDRLELIYDTISGLFEFLTSITAGGSYTLEAPCETAEDGSPLVVEHTYGGAVNSIGVLSNKIDALAAMLQTVKNQKQPVCKAPPRQGQAVTVNFEEV